MKVVQVYKDVHPFVKGGIERYVHDLSVNLSGNGHQVQILVAGDVAEAAGAVLEGGARVTGYPCLGRILSTPVSPGLGEVFRDLDADVFHFHLPLPTAVMAWLLSGMTTPVVVTYHSDIVRQAAVMPLYGPFLKSFLRRARHVIPTSPVYAETSRWLKGLHNLTVVPIGVDPLRFSPSDEAPGDYSLFVGRFRSYKGIEVLLDAWGSFPDRPLIMVGGGPLEGLIRLRSEAEGLNVTVISDPTDQHLLELYRGAGCLILPSTQRSEAFGMVQVEAMACGTPVISTDLPTGVPWVNQNGVSGMVVPPGDSVALAAAVTRMDDQALRRSLSDGALARAGILFNGPILLARVETLLREAAESSGEGVVIG